MKLIQRLTMVMLALASGLLLLGASVFHHQDLSHYKDRIEQLVQDKTGRELKIQGEIHATFFPRPGLSLHQVSLANGAGFDSAKAFAGAARVNLFVELLPLLTGEVTVNRVELYGGTLNLQRVARGAGNWEDLMAQTSVVETRNDEEILQEIEAGAPIVAALSVGELLIDGATVSWLDEQTGERAELRELSLQTSAITLLEPFHLAMQFDAVPKGGEFSTSVVAEGEVTVELSENRYMLELDRLDTVSTASDRPTSHLESALKGRLVADFAAQTIELSALTGKLAEIPVQGEIYVTRLFDDPSTFGELHARGIDGANLLVDLGMRLPIGFDGDLLRDANLHAEIRYAAGELALSEILVEAGGIKLYGDLLAANLPSTPVFSGSWRTDPFDAGPWLSAFGVVLPAEQELFKTVQMQTNLRQSGQLLSFNKLRMQFDDTLIEGDVEVTDIRSAIPPYRFALRANTLDLDKFRDLTLAPGEPAQGVTSPDSGDLPAPDPLVELLQLIAHWDTQGSLELDSLTVAGITLENVEAPIAIGQSGLEIKEAVATLYSGSVFSSVVLDRESEPPRASAILNLNGFEIEPLLRDVLGDQAPLSGTGNANIDLHGRADNLHDLLHGLSGVASLKLTNGALQRVDVRQELRRAAARAIGAAEVDVIADPQPTPYTRIDLSAVIEQRHMRSEDLSMDMPLMRINGIADVDLGESVLDTVLTATLTTGTGQGNDDLVILNGLQIPLRLRGELSDLQDNLADADNTELRDHLTEAMRERREDLAAQHQKLQQDAQQEQDSDLESSLQQRRNSVESKLVNEVPSSSQRQAGDDGDFMRAFETEKARFGENLSDETRRELSNLIDE